MWVVLHRMNVGGLSGDAFERKGKNSRGESFLGFYLQPGDSFLAGR